MFSAFINWFIPGKYKRDLDTYRSSRTMVSTIFITSLFSTTYLLTSWYIGFIPGVLAMTFNAAGFLILPFLFRAGLRRNATAHAYIFIGMTGVLISAFFSGGSQSYILYYLVILPCITLLISDLKSGIFWTVISMSCILILYLMEHHGYVFPNDIPPDLYFIKKLTDSMGLVLIVSLITIVFERQRKYMMEKLEEKNKLIAEEKQKSEDLLLNILPEEISEELKLTGKTKAHSYDMATVMFSDFVDFTKIGEKLSPEELVSAIGDYFETFDNIIESYGIEKIKTVGDAYLCAAGLPIPTTDNALIMMKVAFDFLKAMEELNEKRHIEGNVVFNVRIGINTGPLVAGVVGIKKFAYDIWGDTVNTAARLQENGEPGRINVSGTTYELIKHRFQCAYRGKIPAKNKGEIDMYFVNTHRKNVQV